MPKGYKELTYFYYVRRYNNLSMEQTIEYAANKGIFMNLATLRSIEDGSRRPRQDTLLKWCDIWDGVEYRTALKALNGDIKIARDDWKKLGIPLEQLNRAYPKHRNKGAQRKQLWRENQGENNA
jgi:hypothetical protein